MKYAIVKISKIDGIFDYNRSVVCKYLDNEDDIINYVSEILPNYKSIKGDIINVNMLNTHRQLCPYSDYFIINVGEVKVVASQYLFYNDYLQILKSIRLNKLKQLE